ncbi:protease prsW family-domain-containing protein [Hypomontagnella submonticulosa]|nr:protease prsW family-domain-containing protein [Hypomontagnella submonticulosa]
MDNQNQVTAGNINQPQFSRSTRILLWAVLPALFIALVITSPLTAALSIFILAPTFLLLQYDRAHPADQRVDLETFTWTFVLTGTVGVAAVIIVQLVVSTAFCFALFPTTAFAVLKEVARSESDVATLDADALAARRQIAEDGRYWVFMLAFAFFAAAIPEEVLKYSGVMYAKRRGRIVHERNYVTFGAAAALGFSTFENIGFVYAAAKEDKGVADLVLALAERVLIGSPMHVMSGLLIGMDAARRDFRGEVLSLTQILAVPVLFHGTWDFSLFGVSALDGNVGWIHPRGKSLLLVFGIAATILGTLVFTVQKRFASWRAQQKKSK